MTDGKSKRKPIIWLLISRFLGLVLFLILIAVVNFLTRFIHNPLFNSGVQFVNWNILLMILISLIFLIGELFHAFHFPLNLPGPVFDAIASVFLAVFILRVFTFLDTLIKGNIFQIITTFSFLIYPVVFTIVLLGGYIVLFARLSESESS